MSDIDVLIKGRAEVEKGWCQRHAVDVNGNVCILGGLEVAMGEPRTPRLICQIRTDFPHAVRKALVDALPAECLSVSLARFNDHPDTTKADVLALYDRAINSLVPVGDSAHVHRAVA